MTSEADELNKTMEDRIAASVIQHRDVKQAITDCVAREQEAIEALRSEKDRQKKKAFSEEYAGIQKTLEKADALTYAPWESSDWKSFDIEGERPSPNLTRIGEFVHTGENATIKLPAVLPILGGRNVMLRATGSGRQKARGVLRNIAFRIMASVPSGRLRFVFIDPVELGSIAAGLVGALPDFLTGGVAWHQEQDIEDQLSLMETRIAAIKTKCLGIRFSSLDQYNSDPETKIKEPYWLVVISDCPVRFRDSALQKLLSIAKNGPQAGVHLAIMLDDGQKKCTDSLITELAETAHHIVCPDFDDNIFYDDPDYLKCQLSIDGMPPSELIGRVTKQVSKTAASAQTVRVDWEPPALEDWWKGDSRHGLKIPLGIFGARDVQNFEIDEKLLNSALIIGKPGSGKSRLLHVLVSGLATNYSPDEVALYLLDCKQVEFKDYATHKLPHARVVAIESEREFGLSVMRKLAEELDKRKRLFSTAGETSLSSYRDKTKNNLPRIVLVVDEFQELLYDDALGREAAAILDRLVRLGRALGINVILASQTLTGQTTLLASTKNQIPIRIVLQCSQSDSTAALSQENDEARLLERPGEAIYNSANGRREGNNRFQINWLSDESLESLLHNINHAASGRFSTIEPPVIFDGNSLAEVEQNRSMSQFLANGAIHRKKGQALAWLGEPIEMKESTAAAFKRQSRSNLLILGQNEFEQSCVSIALAGIMSLAAQSPSSAARFCILNLADPEGAPTERLEEIKRSIPHEIDLVAKPQLSDKLNYLLAQIESRGAETPGDSHPSIYLCILGLHRDRNLRRAEGASAFSKIGNTPASKALSNADLLSKICREGASCGIHCLIWCDTFSNFERVFQRNDIDEFSLRVALQMSESDSRSFIDSDAANHLGAHRAIFVDDERHGRLENFRPYSLMNSEWIIKMGKRMTS